MPKQEINYSKALIYRIVCDDLEVKDTYIGSTTCFVSRKHAHKSACTNDKNKRFNTPLYKFIRNNGGWDNWGMYLVEYYPCENKIELEKQERVHIEASKTPVLNKRIPTRSRAEYHLENKEKLAEYKKQYAIDNKDRLAEYKKQYDIENQEEIRKKKVLLNKKYKEKHRAKINESHLCECGGRCRKKDISRHRRSQKHINFYL